jgi:nitronate monooxygenase
MKGTMTNTVGAERLGLRVPVFQAPTGSIAGPELCAAVSLAGAMGAMALTWTAPDVAAAHVRQVQATVGDRPFQVNFALAFAPDALPAALHAGAPIVTFSWGDPAPFVAGSARRARVLESR